MIKSTKLKSGFTLIEMAIVITIIGVLVAAIYSGKDLLDLTKRNQIISDFGKYEKAYHDFEEKYNSPPGDYFYKIINNTGTDPCLDLNPNGNGKIEGYRDSLHEDSCAFQHLDQAGFLKGEYKDYYVTSNPRGPYDKTYYNFQYFSLKNEDLPSAGDDWYGNANALILGRITDDTKTADMGFLKPEDAASIDKKIDDGKPLSGLLSSFNGVGGTGDVDISSDKCVNYNSSDADFVNTTTYNMSGEETACYLIYFMSPPYIYNDD